MKSTCAHLSLPHTATFAFRPKFTAVPTGDLKTGVRFALKIFTQTRRYRPYTALQQLTLQQQGGYRTAVSGLKIVSSLTTKLRRRCH